MQSRPIRPLATKLNNFFSQVSLAAELLRFLANMNYLSS